MSTRVITPTDEEYEAALHALARRRLRHFVDQAWHVLEPTTPFKSNWHIDCIAEHLEAMTRGDIKRLVINVPPGSSKSLLACVFWPAWEWIQRPSSRFLYGTYKEDLAFRDSNKTRDLIKSEWYQQRFGHIFSLRSDQDAQGKFVNDKTGFRLAVSVASATGQRADHLIWDDPHNIEKAESDVDRNAVVNKWRATWSERVADEKTSTRLIIMQRLHQGDICGWLAENQPDDWEFLVIPTEYEGNKYFRTSLHWEDPRDKDDELLWPHHVGPEEVKLKKKTLGPYGWAGQHQQRPAPKEGGTFKASWFPVVDVVPVSAHRVRAWDNASTDGGGDYTVGLLMAKTPDGIYWVEDVVRGQWNATERDRVKRETAERDAKKYLGNVFIWDSQDPGSAGKDAAAASIRNLAGFRIRVEPTRHSKEVNADPFAAQAGAGNVRMLRADWNDDFLAEITVFPAGNHDDIVDACSLAFNKLAPLGALESGLLKKATLRYNVM